MKTTKVKILVATWKDGSTFTLGGWGRELDNEDQVMRSMVYYIGSSEMPNVKLSWVEAEVLLPQEPEITTVVGKVLP